jgi:predicted RNA-binding protein with PUA-like domain
MPNHWLFKTEPTTFSFSDLLSAKDRTTFWHGVRNYQARNMLRDDIKNGDGVLFYHSSCTVPAVVGIAEVVREGYPDHSQFDPSSEYYDPDSTEAEPRWFMVDIRATRELERAVTLEEMREAPALKEMKLLKRGMRLSVQPVTAKEWQAILATAAAKPTKAKRK